MRIEPLGDLSKLGKTSCSGMQKHWVAKSETAYSLQWDYLQKVNYCIQDFNETLLSGKFTNKDVVFLIALDTWIGEAVRLIRGCYREEAVKGFAYSKESELEKSHALIRGLRSIVLAHPLATSDHPDLGLGGDFVCVDIGRTSAAVKLWKKGLHRLTPDGMIDVEKIPDSDIVLSCYSKREGAEFFQHIGFDLLDVRNDAALRVDKLHELDRYLGSLKMRDYV